MKSNSFQAKFLQATLLVCLFILPAAVFAAPVADDERVPLDLRRTTLVVSDIEKSLAFYRDALGMTVSYDNMVNTPRDAKTVEEAKIARRLVFLQANDDFIGVLGLLQYVKPVKEAIDLSDKVFVPGSTVLVFNLEDNRAAFERARQTEGVKVLSEPTETKYPSYDGSSMIHVLVSVLQDPDGIVVEVNQLISDLH
jgi:catechol 2,3-dioxygenase-like lactoylglutathione lyase family enzyme